MRTAISLDGEWQLAHWVEGERSITTPAELRNADCALVAAQVPGNVELDLGRAGLIADPFIGDNMRDLYALESHEWWYARTFDAPADLAGEQCDLTFEGLDTFATVWLNDTEIGRSANMLIAHTFDATAAIRPGRTNSLTVRLGSAVNQARQHHYDASLASSENRDEALFVRKAPHVWGWDIMPRAVSAGIWKPVWLATRPATAIEQIYYWTADVTPDGASLGVRFQFRTDSMDLTGLSMRFRGSCGDHAFCFEWPVEFVAGGCQIQVPEARLWWPHGYGAPSLYAVTAQLCRGSEVLAERVDRIGFRKLRVDRTRTGLGQWVPGPVAEGKSRVDLPPEPDSHFVFYVNDVPIMVKGTNWVPLDAYHSRDASRLEAALALAEDLGCNMIRCWGGNVYQDDAFYDFCDEKGILVWQDFAFACGDYPQSDDFFALVKHEVQVVAERLRNHASLALWCGDNEVDSNYRDNQLSPAHNRLNREIIPQVVHRCDPHRHYVPSSPYVDASIEGLADEGMRLPEQHLWGPRGYFKGPFYSQHTAHFIGEIGYHGCPSVDSIRRFISPGYLWPWQGNDEWQAHAVYHWRHNAIERDRIQLMANQVREFFGAIPTDLDSFALASQISQAEAKKHFIESTRLRKWFTSGILWWNLIDGWPQFSDAVVDYYLDKKLAYHYIRRVQRPVCMIIGEPGRGNYAPVVISNDTRCSVVVSYRVVIADSGEEVLNGSLEVPANQNWQVGRLRTYASDQLLYLISWEVDGGRYGNHYLAGSPPFSLTQYRKWLDLIAQLPASFAVGHG